MSFKSKAIKGFSWTVFEGVLSQGIVFSVGIILARLLLPRDFGIIGIIMAFVSFSTTIVEGGFGSALLRKTDANDSDYTTVFYSNLFVAIILYIILFFFSKSISEYFKEPQLELLLKFAGLILIINAFSIIQQTLLVKKLDFRTKGIISVIASVISGLMAIILAYNNFGVWSLITLYIMRPFINASLLWWVSSWKPTLHFSNESFKSLFNFGFKLLIAGLINSIYKNLYNVLIGKYFSTTSLGYYTRADQFQAPFSSNISRAISSISFPILAETQNDKIRMRRMFSKFLKYSVLINFTVMLSIAAMSESLVILLIGEKWRQSVYYLQLLCVPGMIYPLQILNLNLLSVNGYSNLYLKLEIVKKLIIIPLIVVTVFFGIEIMIYGLIVFSFTEYFINSSYSKKIIDYSSKDQLKDVFPYLCTSLTTFLSMWSITLFNFELATQGIIQIVVGISAFYIFNEFLKLDEYIEIKTKVITFGYKVLGQIKDL